MLCIILNLGKKAMKNFLIIWKPNSGFRHNNSLIRGRTYAEAMQTHFHEYV